MKTQLIFEPIGVVYSSRQDIRDDGWDAEKTHIELDARFSEEALLGLDKFSHIEIIFYMNQIEPERIETGARQPRNNPNWPQTGIFAQRAKNRPNQLGLTVCRLLRINGRNIYVGGLDAIDQTPVLDIKPWVREFGPRGEISQPTWMSELMRDYWRA